MQSYELYLTSKREREKVQLDNRKAAAEKLRQLKVLERKASRDASKSQNTSVIEVVEHNNDQPTLQKELLPTDPSLTGTTF